MNLINVTRNFDLEMREEIERNVHLGFLEILDAFDDPSPQLILKNNFF